MVRAEAFRRCDSGMCPGDQAGMLRLAVQAKLLQHLGFRPGVIRRATNAFQFFPIQQDLHGGEVGDTLIYR